MNVNSRAPTVLPTLPARTASSPPRGATDPQHPGSFQETLTKSQRADRAAERLPADDDVGSVPPRSAKATKREAADDRPATDAAPAIRTAEEQQAQPTEGGEEVGDVAIDGAAGDGTEGSVVEGPVDGTDAEAGALAPVAVQATAVNYSAVGTIETMQGATQAVTLSAAAPALSQPAKPTPRDYAHPAAVTGEPVIIDSGSPTAAGESSSVPTPASSMPAVNAPTNSGPAPQKITASNAIDATLPSPSSLPAGSGEAAAPTVPPAAAATNAGKEAFAAPFAQTLTSDDAALRDDVNMGRVVRGLTTAVNQRGGSVTLRLTPPELGAVRIEMTVRDGAVTARFTAATEAVRHLLTDQMGHLRSALDRQGLVVERIEVQASAPQTSSGGFDRQMDDAGRDGRSAGEYTRQGGGRGDGRRGERGGAEVDSFQQTLAGVAE